MNKKWKYKRDIENINSLIIFNFLTFYILKFCCIDITKLSKENYKNRERIKIEISSKILALG